MGNKVTKTTVETVKINSEDDTDDTVLYNNNKINGNALNDYPQYQQKELFQSITQKPEWDYYNQDYSQDYSHQQFDGDEEVGYDRINGRPSVSSDSNKSQKINTVQEYSDEISDVVSDMKDQKLSNDLNGRKTPLIVTQTTTRESLPLFVRSYDGNDDNIREIDELESIESGSKLTLNDAKSDTEEVIQELDKLMSETEDKESHVNKHFRKRGQSWSNWDNNVNVELKAESSLSSFSRPTSQVGKTKPKSFTAPETRGQIDSAIEWLAKQHGLDIGSSLDYERHKPIDSRNSKNTLRISSMEIPGTVSTASTPALNENESQVKYDDLDKELISSIENDYMR